jgi:hypothetical protein
MTGFEKRERKREREGEREGERERERERERGGGREGENIFLVSKFGRKLYIFTFSSRNSGGKYLSFCSRSRNWERENHDV